MSAVNKVLMVLLYGVLGLLFAPQPRADDIDIYSGGGGAGAGPARFMLALDLRAGVQPDLYDALRAALRSVLLGLADATRGAGPGERIEVGLMALYGAGCTGAGPLGPDYSPAPPADCSQGAFVLRGFSDISIRDNLEHLLQGLAALPEPGRRAPWLSVPWPGDPYRLRDIYLELLRYLGGGPASSGYLEIADAGSTATGGLYHSPLAPGEECPRIAMVNFQFGPGAPSSPATNAALAALVAAGGQGIQLEAGEAGDLALLAALAAAGPTPGEAGSAGLPRVRSYFLAPQPGATLQAMAVAGGTGRAYSLADPRSMLASLEALFSDVVGGPATLVAGAVPVNGYERSRSNGDIFFALFQPGASPLWSGNIKKLKLVETIEAAGAVGGPVGTAEIIAQAPLSRPPVPAIAPEDGGIRADALTFWTDPAGADVLAFDPALGEVAGRDGRSVTRGGAGQQIPGYLTHSVGANNTEPEARQLFTLDPVAPGELLALDASPATALALADWLDPGGAMSSAELVQLLRWIRGQDGFDADGDGDASESRPWLLADPLHSRPLVVNYGARPGTSYSAGQPDTRLFFGTNDGLFHVVRNTSDSGGGQESGRESWAFLPPEFMPMQAGLARNQLGVVGSHPYGMDGEAVAYVRDIDQDGAIEPGEGDVVWVYIGQRRGGRGLYAFDMTDPDSPRVMWKIDHTSPDFDQLALTFSTPRLARLDLGGDAPTPVLVFGGGYNGGWSGAGRTGKDAGDGDDLIGNAIYVVNAADGELIWRAVGPNGGETPQQGQRLHFVAGLTDSIPSPLTLVDSDHNGLEDRAYVGDSGGNVWRIDLTEYARREPGTAATDGRNWYVTRLADLGDSGASDRRFFHAPDVVQSRDASGEYDGVVIVSGNRATPRELLTDNFAYLLKDRRTAASRVSREVADGSPPLSHNQLADITGACSSADTVTCLGAELAFGWKLELTAPGEKGLSTPLTSNGAIWFTSYVPVAGESPELCTREQGSGRVYNVLLRDGSPALPLRGGLTVLDETNRYREIGPGLPGDVVAIGRRLLIPGKGIDDIRLLTVEGRSRWRAYWREEGVDSP